MAISFGESIGDRPRSPTPPVPIAIPLSWSPLLSFTPVWCMDTANFINTEVWVCFSFSKHNIFSTKAIESFVVVWYLRRDPSVKPATRFFDSTLKNSLTFALNTKTMQMAREEVAKVLYCYYSRDSREIVWKFPCLEAAKFTDRDWTFWDVLPAALRVRFRTLRPAKGLRNIGMFLNSSVNLTSGLSSFRQEAPQSTLLLQRRLVCHSLYFTFIPFLELEVGRGWGGGGGCGGWVGGLGGGLWGKQVGGQSPGWGNFWLCGPFLCNHAGTHSLGKFPRQNIFLLSVYRLDMCVSKVVLKNVCRVTG